MKTSRIFAALASAARRGIDAPPALASDTVDWKGVMNIPSLDAQQACSTGDTAPYLTSTPDFGGTDKYIEYAVDFRCEYLPETTYLGVASWCAESNQLKAKYAKVKRDYGLAGYCGFQVLHDGSHVAIMSVWDTFCTDARGSTTTIKAKLIYPETDPTETYRNINTDNGKVQWGDEGRFAQCVVPYNWKEDHNYRAVVQIYNTYTRANAYVNFSVCDLETGEWTRLIAFDLGYDDAYMTWNCTFLENWLASYAGRPRAVVLGNYRVRSYPTGEWVWARKTVLAQAYNHKGSYNYGSADGKVWMISCGIPGLSRNPAPETHALSHREW